MPKIIANDISIYYQITGNSDHSVILISGANGDHQSVWPAEVVNALAQHFQVIQFDHRGVGQSDQPDIPYSIEMMTDDVAGLMEALQIEASHVIGYSMGGQIAAKLAEKYPAKVLTMIGCVCYPTINMHVRLLGKAMLELMELKLPSSIIDKIGLPWVFSDQFLEENVSSLTQSEEEPTSKSSIGFKRHFEAQCAFITSEAECFRNIDIPALFIAGTEDRICPPSDVMKFVDLIPNSKITVFPEAGHMLSLEHPYKFAEVICEFLIPKKDLMHRLSTKFNLNNK